MPIYFHIYFLFKINFARNALASDAGLLLIKEFACRLDFVNLVVFFKLNKQQFKKLHVNKNERITVSIVEGDNKYDVDMPITETDFEIEIPEKLKISLP